jgi:hypothetical protein
MMDFISIPTVVGIVFLGVYKLFELFVRRKERLTLIEKMGEKFDASLIDNKFSFPKSGSNPLFGTLKVACLLLGVGLGLLVGFFICNAFSNGIRLSEGGYANSWDIAGVIYGASTLLFGGLGLLIAFVVELKNTPKN